MSLACPPSTGSAPSLPILNPRSPAPSPGANPWQQNMQQMFMRHFDNQQQGAQQGEGGTM